MANIHDKKANTDNIWKMKNDRWCMPKKRNSPMGLYNKPSPKEEKKHNTTSKNYSFSNNFTDNLVIEYFF